MGYPNNRRNGDRLPESGLCADQRIDHAQLRKAAEVAVARPQLAHAMLQAQGRDPRIMDLRVGNASGSQQLAQNRPVGCRLAD